MSGLERSQCRFKAGCADQRVHNDIDFRVSGQGDQCLPTALPINSPTRRTSDVQICQHSAFRREARYLISKHVHPTIRRERNNFESFRMSGYHL